MTAAINIGALFAAGWSWGAGYTYAIYPREGDETRNTEAGFVLAMLSLWPVALAALYFSTEGDTN